MDKKSPDIFVLAPNNMNFKGLSSDDIFQDLRAGKYLKYIYQNKQYSKDEVKNMIKNKEIILKADQIFYLDINKFKKIVNGACLKLEGERK